MTTGVDVVVPIYNARDDAAACIESVLGNTEPPFRLVLIDDGSTDPAIRALLAPYRDRDDVLIVDRAENGGFARAVNEGFAASTTSDVVILNSDTIVTRGWLGKLRRAAARRPDVATVTPLTNNGTICSVPEPLVDNTLPAGYDVEAFAALVEETSLRLFPEAPTGVGFCMLVTRRALEAIGGFDAATFGRGYGEENDFCQRAIAAGFVNVIADDTFVYHRGRASYGPDGPRLLETNLSRVAARHPRYLADVARFCAAHPLAPFHAYLRESIAAGRARSGPVRMRVLHLLHRGGGTEKHARDLAALDDPGVVSYVLRSDGRRFEVDEYYQGRRLRRMQFPLRAEIPAHGPPRNDDYRDALTEVCAALDVGLIHVHHLMHHTVDIAVVAAARGIPYVMTLHDYYTVCPSYTLLAPDARPCRACLGGPGAPRSSEACLAHAGLPASALPERQDRMARFLAGAARIFVPSTTARDVVGKRFPTLVPSMSVIEHGHGRVPGDRAPIPVDHGRALRVAVIGGLEPHKGSRVFRDLLRANRRPETTFHFYGVRKDPALDTEAFVDHGPYEGSGEIVRKLRDDGIHVGLLLSVWPETFSYTVSELVDAGIPVIAGAGGAPAERIDRHRLGWVVSDITDPHATLSILDDLLAHPGRLADVANGMRRDDALPSLETMWRRYLAFYRELAGSGRTSMDSDTRYLAWLGMKQVDLERRLGELEATTERQRALLDSPRHRIAAAVGDVLQKTPIVWPVVAGVTEAVLRWRRARRARG